MYEWRQIPWRKLEREVFKLQKRIYQASSRGETKAVRKLQRILVNSWSARCLAVRRVTQDNKGKKTAGIDGQKSLNPKERLMLVNNLANVKGKTSPNRRVWISKPGTDEKRPLGIPTITDRARQALMKIALEPEWEAKFEPNSYGFRPGRSAHDAIEAIHDVVCHKPKYVLDADISKCFDRINHDALLQKLNTSPKFSRVIKTWLRAGVLDNGGFEPTDKGTPQGGVISPLLANVALHGMEEEIRNKTAKYCPIQRRKVHATLIRYADDFVVIHDDLNIILEAKEIISTWLSQIGLELKPSKTRITHTLEKYEGNVGFDFLGFHVCLYKTSKFKGTKKNGAPNKSHTERQKTGYKCLIKPSKESIQRHLKELGDIIDKAGKSSQADVIIRLNQTIIGWTNYYKIVASSETFRRLEWLLFDKLWAWAKRRHPLKSKSWVANKYWHTDEKPNGRRWDFLELKDGRYARLHQHTDTKITRHTKVRPEESPYSGNWTYWSLRTQKHPGVNEGISKLLRRQKGKCEQCGLFFRSEDAMEKDHIIPRSQGGTDEYKNLRLLHRHCHDKVHQSQRFV